jgi:hypothetical protein
LLSRLAVLTKFLVMGTVRPDGYRAGCGKLVPGGASVVTVTSDGPLPRQAVADGLDEADDYQLAGN